MATLPNPVTWSPGPPAVAAADLNAELRDPLLFFLNAPTACAYRNTDQTLATGVAEAIEFTGERWDNDTMWSVGNPTRLTATTAGVYVITGAVIFTGNTTGERTLEIRHSVGSATLRAVNVLDPTGSNQIMEVSRTYKLAAGDYVELYALQSSGGDLDIISAGAYSPEFDMTWVSKG